MLWQDRFSLGIPVIDEQHKQLVDLVEEVKGLIHDAEDGVDCYDDITYVLESLKDYTISHFAEEEAMMEAHGYNKLNAHRMEHAAFVAKVQDFLSKDIDFEQLSLLEDVVTFLLDWIIEHILVTDSQYDGVVK